MAQAARRSARPSSEAEQAEKLAQYGPTGWSSCPSASAGGSGGWSRAGVRWRWDEVIFELLHPPTASYENPALRPNSRSCVLRITTPYGAVLLTGDIEERDEGALVSSGSPLRAMTLLVPHHGSGTSSTTAFIAAVKPEHAIFAVGYRNRFVHPKRDVLARYEAAGVQVWRTDRDGAITLKLAPAGTTVTGFRAERQRYWR